MTHLDKTKELILQKSVLKQDIFENIQSHFMVFKKQAQEIEHQLKNWCADARISIKYSEEHRFEFWLQVGGDLLIFSMHTNVFSFPEEHVFLKSKYVKEDTKRGFCGMIEVYNFLNDSIKYQRNNDIGELIARVFINSENHFFVEANGPLGFKYRDYDKQIIDENAVFQLIENFINSSIEFDLWVPNFNDVRYVPLNYLMMRNGENPPHETSKRLGFDIYNLDKEI